MKPSTGRWVSGDDFFGRAGELKSLKSMACEGNHVQLFGQRRMGNPALTVNCVDSLKAMDGCRSSSMLKRPRVRRT